MKRLLVSSLVVLTFLSTTHAAIVNLQWAYNFPSAQTILGSDSLPLSGSGSTADGDGFALQLGYYTGATAGNPFLGTWVPVFGETSNSLFANAGMGDGKAVSNTDARFVLNANIDTSVASTLIGVPAAGQIMAIRFYNAISVSAATYFGAAANASWLWVAPSDPQPTGMSFNMKSDPGVVFLGGGSTPQTNQVLVPEPSSILLGFLGLTALAARRRR
jgi:hypothetical protein